jgi:hypothetical protein
MSNEYVSPVRISPFILFSPLGEMLCLGAGIAIVLYAQHRSKPSTPIRRALLLAATVGCAGPAILLYGTELIQYVARFKPGEAPFPLNFLAHAHVGAALYTISQIMFIPFILLLMLYLLHLGKQLRTPRLRWTTCAVLIALALVNVFDLSELTLVRLIRSILGGRPFPPWLIRTIDQGSHIADIANMVLYAAVALLMLLYRRRLLTFARRQPPPLPQSHDSPSR